VISFGIWLVIVLVCFGAGAAALRRLRAESHSYAEEIPLAVALGMGLLAYLMLAAGLLGCLRPWVGIALVALLAVLGLPHVARLARHILAAARTTKWRWSALPLLLFLAAAAALTLVGALAPSTDLDYDGLVYHLAVPKIYIADGRIHSIPWLSHSNFPFNLEMLYLLGLLLQGQSLAKLFHFGCGWLMIGAIFAFGRRWWGARAGWLGAAIFVAIPLVAWQMVSAYNELAFALYAFLAIHALSRWLEGRGKSEGDGWLWVAAIMCGLALGVKMLAAAVLLFSVIALVWALIRRAAGPRAVIRIIAFCALALAVASPWYIKSYCWTGNLVYPFFYHVFDGEHWTQERADAYAEAQEEFGVGKRPLAFVALPWDLTMKPRWFFDQPGQLRPFNVLITVFGPLLLAFLPALFLTGPVGGAGRLLLWFGLFYAAVWFGLTQNGRYLMPILPGLCACAGLAASRLLDRPWRTGPAVVVALFLGLLSGLYPAAALAAPAVRVVAGAEAESAYLTRNSQIYPMLTAVSMATPTDARILVLGDEPRLFYLDREYLLGNHTEIFTSQDLAGADALLNAFDRLGVTHLLLHSSTENDMRSRSGAMATRLAELDAAGTIRLRLRVRATRGDWSLSLWEVASGRSERPR